MNKKDLKKITYLENLTIDQLMKSFGMHAHLTSNKAFCLVVSKQNKCLGTITDGDIRRYLNTGGSISDPISRIAKKKFIFLKYNRNLNLTLRKFENLFSISKGIFTLPVLSKNGNLIDVLNYNEIIKNISNKKIISIEKKKSKKYKKNEVTISVPARLSFIGGGYDFTDFISKYDNFILSVALNYRIYIKLRLRKDNNVLINITNISKKKFYTLKNIKKIKISFHAF